MKTIKKRFRGAVSLLVILALLCGMGVSAVAASPADLDFTRTGSVSLTLRSGDEIVNDGALTLYRVADLFLDDGNMAYSYTDDFEDCEVVLDEDSLSDWATLGEELAAYLADHDAEGTEVYIGEDGTVVFENLPLGLYLIEQSESSTGFYDIDPFVVTVPREKNGELVYDIDAAPKTEMPGELYADLGIQKVVSQGPDLEDIPGVYSFLISLSRGGTPLDGYFDVTYTGGEEERTETAAFVNGEAEFTLTAGETAVMSLPYGTEWIAEELLSSGEEEEEAGVTVLPDTVTVYAGEDMASHTENWSDGDFAPAADGTITEDTLVRFVNSYREFFDIDEEIVDDQEDIFNRDSWVKNETANEYNAIEIEMTTVLPVVTAGDLADGNFTMQFHNELVSQLNLDEAEADFSVYIAGTQVSHEYYNVYVGEETEDDCSFHVTVDLTALYNDGIITEEDLQGETEITIFFFVDLEGTGLNGTYSSAVWYQVYDDEELLYTSGRDVVYVYTFEIDIFKYSKMTGEGLAGAVFGVYYDPDCTEPVSRSDEYYTNKSDKNGSVMFYGLAEGTYYLKELASPDGYIMSEDVYEVTLDTDLEDYVSRLEIANTPAEASPGGAEEPEPTEPPAETEEPEPTESPAETEEPEPTEPPAETEEPEPTEPPAETEEPEPTEPPAETEEPEPTESSAGTEEPEPTESPAETEEPGATESPAETEEPEATESPAGAEEPTSAETPAVTEAPVQTEIPSETEEPEETRSPVAVGGTDTTTPSGGSSTGGSSGSTVGDTLPQTGMILWPVIVLGIAGAGMIAAGFVLRRKRGEA